MAVARDLYVLAQDPHGDRPILLTQDDQSIEVAPNDAARMAGELLRPGARHADPDAYGEALDACESYRRWRADRRAAARDRLLHPRG